MYQSFKNWMLTNCTFLLIIILATFFEVGVAKFLLGFTVICLIIISWGAVWDKEHLKKCFQNPNTCPVSRVIDVSYDIVVLALLAGTGWLWTALGYMVFITGQRALEIKYRNLNN